MAEVIVKDKIDANGTPNSIGHQMYEAEYDFSVDGGAFADTYTLIEFADAVAIRLKACKVETAFTSGGAATVSLGVTASGTEMLNAVAIASFTAGSVLNQTTPGAFYKVEDGEKIVLALGTADLTAGKAKFLFEVIAS